MIPMASSIILGWNVLTRRSRWHFGRSGVPKPRCHDAQKLSDFSDGSIIPRYLFGIFSFRNGLSGRNKEILIPQRSANDIQSRERG